MHEMVAKFLLFSSTESVFCIVSCQGVVQLGGPDPWYEGKMDLLKVRLQPQPLYNLCMD